MAASTLDVLLVLLGHGEVADGTMILEELHAAGRKVSAAQLFSRLLELESAGFVDVDRRDGHGFALTSEGEAIAYELGPGDPFDVVLVVADLVGFVAFTDEHGDIAAH